MGKAASMRLGHLQTLSDEYFASIGTQRHSAMEKIQTELLSPGKSGISHAAALLRDGELVAFPTETVYGLGADACNDGAVRSIYTAKNRPPLNPLIVHVATIAMAKKIALFSDLALKLAEAFWPGPLALVLPVRPGSNLSSAVTAGHDTVAIRVPDHAIANELLTEFGGPVAAPSANPSGKMSPTTPAHVLQGLNGLIAAVIDGGPCQVGVESTIIGFEPSLVVHRPGGLPMEAIKACVGITPAQSIVGDKPVTPGQFASHYAPEAPLRLNANSPRENELFLGFGKVACDVNLSEAGDLNEAATNLFQALRDLDRPGHTIAVSPIPDLGIGLAINDRLKRAAAPRDVSPSGAPSGRGQ